MLNIQIRSEKVSDIEAIHLLGEKAFGQPDEANMVCALRDKGALTFSLVAIDNATQTLLGHLAFSMLSIEGVIMDGTNKSWPAIGLAPISVLPEYQRQGIGSHLIEFWFENYGDAYFNAVFVLGDPEYYSRFGFQRASDYGFRWEYDCPSEAFQVRELKAGFLKKAAGVVYYDSVFSDSPGH